jgi:dihydropteroate synthase
VNSDQFRDWCLSFNPILTALPPYKTLIMGILNVTPDSFSDGGRYLKTDLAVKRAREMVFLGADLIDIGGESSRPGATGISSQEELDRVIPVIEAIRQESDVCISIDTTKAPVMHDAVMAGASIINDIKALSGPGSMAMAKRLNVPICLMHMQGDPHNMQDNPHYARDVVSHINNFFHERVEACIAEGIDRRLLVLDPGFGFGKSVEDNLKIIKRLSEFQQNHLPLLLGVSRKSTLGAIVGKETIARVPAGLAAGLYARLRGVSIIRTHDIDETRQSLSMIEAILSVDDNCKGAVQV